MAAIQLPHVSPTKVWHASSYDAIDPKVRPELSTKDKVIVITGGGSGIGAAIARSFASAGSTGIALLGRTQAKLVSTAESIQKEYPAVKFLTWPTDVADTNSVNAAFDQIVNVFGGADICVSNAGHMSQPGPIATADAEEWMQSFSVNVKGSLLIAQAFLRIAKEGGSLLNTSTAFAHIPTFGLPVSAYATSKTASVRLFEFIAEENPGIHVVSVHPGIVATPGAKEQNMAMDVDDVELPGNFFVWLTSPEAAFLRGKFVWTNWDVEELKSMKESIVDSEILNIGMRALSFKGASLDTMVQLSKAAS